MGSTGVIPQLPLAAIEDVVAAHAALDAARRLGILDRLADNPWTAADLASDLDLDERHATLLLRALTVIGLVEADGGTYRTAPSVPAAVDRLEAGFASLTAGLRRRHLGPSADRPEGSEALYPTTVTFLGDASTEPAAEAAARLARPDLLVLDAGAGAAPWSLALVEREPSCRVVAVDLPGVLPDTRTAVDRAGRSERVRVLGADLFAMPVRPRFDLVIAANLLHLFDRSRAGDLLGRLAGALRPGGRLAVVDAIPDGSARSRGLALYELGLVLRTRSGAVHDAAAYRSWLEAAGLVEPRREPLPGRRELHLLTARRPRDHGT